MWNSFGLWCYQVSGVDSGVKAALVEAGVRVCRSTIRAVSDSGTGSADTDDWTVARPVTMSTWTFQNTDPDAGAAGIVRGDPDTFTDTPLIGWTRPDTATDVPESGNVKSTSMKSAVKPSPV